VYLGHAGAIKKSKSEGGRKLERCVMEEVSIEKGEVNFAQIMGSFKTLCLA